MKPIFSILIATKNRIQYCINVIETILKYNDSDFELVIQDNSDSLELKKFVDENITDKRLKYNYTPPPFSSIDNFNAAIELAEGEYICLIGDDDGINPEIFKIVRWASQNQIDAIVPDLNTIYWWPDACKLIKEKNQYNGLLQITPTKGNVHRYSTKREILKLLQNGGQDYLNFNLPKLYHGVVKKEFLDKIKSKTGNFIGGLSPDIYSAIAIANYVPHIIKIEYPLTIPGICGTSTSADSGRGKHEGNFEDIPHLRDRKNYIWAEQVPKFYSVETIWADSAIAALTDLNRFDLLKKFNITSLTFFCLRNHKPYSELIIKNYKNNNNIDNNIYRWFYSKIMKLKFFKLRTTKILRNGKKTLIRKLETAIGKGQKEANNQEYFEDVEDIKKATDSLAKHLSNQNLSIDLIIHRLNTKYPKI